MQHPSNRTQPPIDKPALLFKTASWIGLKQQVLHLAQFGGSIQVVWGAPGAGKSTFLQLLVNEPDAELVDYRVPDRCSLEVLFRSLLQKLGLRPEPGMQVGQMIAAMRSYCQALERSQCRAVVVLDDAHRLGSSELATVISILQGNVDSGFGLHLVLLAEPELLARLDQLQLVDISVHDMPLPAFAPSELNALLAQYQQVEGWAPMTAEQVQRLWTQSGGLPGVALGLIAEQSSKTVGRSSFGSFKGWPLGHVAALALLVMLLGWALLVRQPAPTPESVVIPVTPEPRPVIRSEPLDADAEPRLAHPGGLQIDPGSIGPGGSADVNQADRGAVVAARERPSSQRPLGEITIGQGVERSAVDPGADFDNDSVASGSNVDAGGIARDFEGQEDRRDRSIESIQEVPSSRAEVESAMPPAAAPAPTPAPAPAPRVAERRSPAEAWLADSRGKLSQLPGQGYVLQLMATADLSAMHHFVTRQPNTEHLRGYTTLRNGQSLHILVEGFYADRASAAAAISNLPAEQRRAGPWPKQVSTVKAEMRP